MSGDSFPGGQDRPAPHSPARLVRPTPGGEWELHRETEGARLATELRQRRETAQQEAEEARAQRDAAAVGAARLQAERDEWARERAERERQLLAEEQGLGRR